MHVIVFTTTFGLVGLSAPLVSGALLSWRRKAYEEWFDGSASDVLAFRLKNDRSPSSKASGHEGALGIWVEGLPRMAADRCLSRSQAVSAIEALGSDPFQKGFDPVSLPTDERLREEFSVPLETRRFMLCMALMALCGFACSFMSVHAIGAVLYCGIVLVSVVLALCDIRSRTIPFVLSPALALFGAAFQWASFGLEGLADTALIALVFGGALLLTSIVGSALRKSRAVGMGDVLAMPAVVMCAGFPGAVYGLVLGFVFGAAALVARRMMTGSRIRGFVPFGPVLAVCGIAGPLFTMLAISP